MQRVKESEDKMQLVIEISDGLNNNLGTIKNGSIASKIILDCVRKGIPLSKGHGRIGDLDKFIKAMKERNDDNGGEPLNAVDRGYDLAYQHVVKEAEECVIIEADKEDDE
jgi:hypothetical protein